MARNLLKNPNGDEGMAFWKLTKNGGNGWKVENMPEDHRYNFFAGAVSKYFTTSFELCLKTQEIDLVAEGYDPRVLDTQKVTVTVQDWYSGRTDCGCTYKVKVNLLDKNRKILEVFSPAEVSLDPAIHNCSWRQVTHTVTVNPGLRYITFEHGGKDNKRWQGWYGVRVTGSSVTVDLENAILIMHSY
ncbi:F-box only protein 6-like [Trichomycterus rosablanca]|uniref:F-box only protein 6-like n=1 Tax=Trichomycterus rosablanca TaxID=2290929 RepID=UPI002F35594A